jgi:hypothetical protein
LLLLGSCFSRSSLILAFVLSSWFFRSCCTSLSLFLAATRAHWGILFWWWTNLLFRYQCFVVGRW